MRYELSIKNRAVKDLDPLPPKNQERILQSLETLQDSLAGDVKKLTNHIPEYRLRVGNYRILFSLEDGAIVVHRIVHRSDAY